MARRQHARFLVVYVANRSSMASMSPEAASAAEAALEQSIVELRDSVESYAAWAGIAVKFLAVRGDPFTEICRIATAERADAVVVGASTRRRIVW
jgi:nucleotide-binding universal stress UspA family protein